MKSYSISESELAEDNLEVSHFRHAKVPLNQYYDVILHHSSELELRIMITHAFLASHYHRVCRSRICLFEVSTSIDSYHISYTNSSYEACPSHMQPTYKPVRAPFQTVIPYYNELQSHNKYA